MAAPTSKLTHELPRRAIDALGSVCDRGRVEHVRICDDVAVIRYRECTKAPQTPRSVRKSREQLRFVQSIHHEDHCGLIDHLAREWLRAMLAQVDAEGVPGGDGARIGFTAGFRGESGRPHAIDTQPEIERVPAHQCRGERAPDDVAVAYEENRPVLIER